MFFALYWFRSVLLRWGRSLNGASWRFTSAAPSAGRWRSPPPARGSASPTCTQASFRAGQRRRHRSSRGDVRLGGRSGRCSSAVTSTSAPPQSGAIRGSARAVWAGRPNRPDRDRSPPGSRPKRRPRAPSRGRPHVASEPSEGRVLSLSDRAPVRVDSQQRAAGIEIVTSPLSKLRSQEAEPDGRKRESGHGEKSQSRPGCKEKTRRRQNDQKSGPA